MHPHITEQAVHAASKVWHQKYRPSVPYDPVLDWHPLMVEVLAAARPHMT
jgi:hypothetical protein